MSHTTYVTRIGMLFSCYALFVSVTFRSSQGPQEGRAQLFPSVYRSMNRCPRIHLPSYPGSWQFQQVRGREPPSTKPPRPPPPPAAVSHLPCTDSHLAGITDGVGHARGDPEAPSHQMDHETWLVQGVTHPLPLMWGFPLHYLLHRLMSRLKVLSLPEIS